MFSSIQSIPGLIFARSDVKAKIRPGVEANVTLEELQGGLDVYTCIATGLLHGHGASVIVSGIEHVIQPYYNLGGG